MALGLRNLLQKSVGMAGLCHQLATSHCTRASQPSVPSGQTPQRKPQPLQADRQDKTCCGARWTGGHEALDTKVRPRSQLLPQQRRPLQSNAMLLYRGKEPLLQVLLSPSRPQGVPTGTVVFYQLALRQSRVFCGQQPRDKDLFLNNCHQLRVACPVPMGQVCPREKTLA